MTRRALIAAVLLVAACSKKKLPAYAADGTCHHPEGCAAPVDYPNQYMIPDEDRPPPGTDPWGPGPPGETRQASCIDVGHVLASLELGNWADEATLAPAISKHRAACTRAKLDEEERQCIFEATDRDALAWCAPRMVPGAKVAVIAAKDCAPITSVMRVQTKTTYQSQPIVEKQLLAIEESCENDRWTVAFGNCVRNVPYPGHVSMYCAGTAPLPLRKKIEDRLAQAK